MHENRSRCHPLVDRGYHHRRLCVVTWHGGATSFGVERTLSFTFGTEHHTAGERGVAFTLDVAVAEVGGLAIAAPDGSTIGDDPAGLIAALPDLRGAFVEQDPGLDRIYFDSTNAEYAAYTYAFAGQGLQQIISPYMLEEYC